MPSVKRRQPKAGAGLEPPINETLPSDDVNVAVVKLIDALTALVKEVTTQLKEER